VILAPNSRLLLLDSLKPPPGFHVDAAVGTTYTLSLDALLIPPAAWASHAVAEYVDAVDPILLANTLRLFAERTLVFHQAGFAAPFAVGYQALAPFLDEMVFPVVVAPGSTFHPKVWVLRFRNESGETGLRVLIGSRNLSLVTTWDVMVRLDSSTDEDGVIDGSPLAAMLRSLPDRSSITMSTARRAMLNDLASDLEATSFQPPAGAQSAEIFAWRGKAPTADVFPATCEHRLVISPFVGGDLLGDLPPAGQSGRSVLVSRPASLSSIATSRALDSFEAYTLQTDAAGLDDEAVSTAAEGEDPAQPLGEREARLGSDLHAKVFAFDDGERATVVLGSANATGAAFANNDEVVVRLSGSADQIGVLQILGESDAESDDDDRDLDLGMLLESWSPGDETDDPEDDGRFFDTAITAVASVGIDGTCVPAGDDLFELTLQLREQPAVPKRIGVEFSLLGRADPLPQSFLRCEPVCLELSLDAITRLVQARFSDLTGEQRDAVSVLLADFEPPPGRHVRALRALLTDKERFLRFLRFLLASSRTNFGADPTASRGASSRSRRRDYRRLLVDDGPILEQLLRLLAQHPTELRHLRAVIDEFADDQSILPPDFHQLWTAIEPLIPVDDEAPA